MTADADGGDRGVALSAAAAARQEQVAIVAWRPRKKIASLAQPMRAAQVLSKSSWTARRALSTSATKRLYRILEIEPDALPAEVKIAYVLKAKKTHPDICKDDGAASRFREIQNAYSILRDPEKRKMYDEGCSESDIEGPPNAQGRASSSQQRGRQSYKQWKNDTFQNICKSLGIGDPFARASILEDRATAAFAAARQRDFGPARQFGRENRGFLVGFAVSTVLTGGVPVMLLFMKSCVHRLDANAAEMLKVGPGPFALKVLRTYWRPWRASVQDWRQRARRTYTGGR